MGGGGSGGCAAAGPTAAKGSARPATTGNLSMGNMSCKVTSSPRSRMMFQRSAVSSPRSASVGSRPASTTTWSPSRPAQTKWARWRCRLEWRGKSIRVDLAATSSCRPPAIALTRKVRPLPPAGKLSQWTVRMSGSVWRKQRSRRCQRKPGQGTDHPTQQEPAKKDTNTLLSFAWGPFGLWGSGPAGRKAFGLSKLFFVRVLKWVGGQLLGIL